MASYTDVRSKRATLSATTADTVTLTLDTPGPNTKLLVTNESADQLLSFTVDGTTPTQGSDDAYHVPAGKTLELRLGSVNNTVVTVAGDGNTYIVQLV